MEEEKRKVEQDKLERLSNAPKFYQGLKGKPNSIRSSKTVG